MSELEDKRYWFGFDLGGTKMLGVVFDEDLKPLGRKRKKTKGHRGAEAGLQRMIDVIEGACEEAEIDPAQLKGLGMGCPGPLNLSEGIMKQAPNLGWVDVPVKDHLENHFGCPVVICNDVDAGVFGEALFGAGRGARTVLGMSPGTGIGGGLVYEGKMVHGANHSCLEVGHIQVMPDGPLCGCGLHGCLEAVASRLAVAAAVAQAAYRGQAPYILEHAGTDIANIRSGVLAAAIEQGDKAVAAIIRRAAHFIGVAVGGLVHTLSPDVVVLGGGLVEAMPKLFGETVLNSARSKVIESYRETFRVEIAELGDDSAAIGAAAWARKSLVELAGDQ